MDQLPFIPNQVYNRRSSIHAMYGGNQQSGISSSSTFPYIFIFSGKTGHQHGYHDSWLNPSVFSYTGEGQIGDMEFTRGNLALKDHKQKGKRVFLFESEGRGFAKFICEVEVFDADYLEGVDTAGKPRIAIVFFFNRKGVQLPIQPHLFSHPERIGRKSYVEYELKPPNETERKGLVTSRVGQGFFRNCILHRWEYKCAVTGFEKRDVLIASHILPWAKSTNEERLDPHNGILLSPTYDALFDRHLISFENSGKIILKETIEPQAFKKIGVTGLEIIKNFNSDNHFYLEKHRLHFNEKH
ncbi:MAG: HNH endonuclease [Saprospiraceae bacterium]|uniref:HNH endonuclease n=1 Tax=Candidatus Opimibacter skivensis TaxID=2982028 RepID=A0A9D7SXH7_9BACT|nr:HNH endonuclease [Candidatus Opimibacter skivensis]